MKLFYSPGACSIGIHVILEEIGKPFETQVVSTRDGSNKKPEYLAINPKAKVPALLRDDGKVLTEFPVIAWWLAKANPMSNLIAVEFEAEARTLEWMDYLCGTVHPQGFTRQFRPGNFAKDAEDEARVIAQGKALAEGYLQVIEKGLAGDPWLLPSGYSVADCALFFITGWASGRAGMTLPPKLARHHAAMLARPAVQRALAREAK
ncbi:glutathione S-transferase N-terminal domain-containing protein [Roseococcus sp. SDR]|uniref:glutathione S-transferase family protein n=1 Tax=Roseococcus sp. SDR TaxID=2835532 RepID=UPI001BD1B0BB|nr:glutathione S-transferase N-terminal domain-containing protein [Roseococcus sp. SDR]MBS7791394.1 glutathione S-transferase N-terminal domain-containing protein [Roseococcus sp. SDR]MBV1846708.1 glutathione S-transferase N-terminal domain-containing protein [Roseococcus sp. SDR]